MNIQITVQPEVALAVAVGEPVVSIAVEATPEIELRPAVGDPVSLMVVTVQREFD